MIINHIFCSNKNLLCKDKSIIEINLQVSSRGSTQIIPSMGCENSTEDQASQFKTAVTLLIYQIYHYFLPWGLIPDEIDEKKWKSVSHVDIIFQNLFEILKRMTNFQTEYKRQLTTSLEWGRFGELMWITGDVEFPFNQSEISSREMSLVTMSKISAIFTFLLNSIQEHSNYKHSFIELNLNIILVNIVFLIIFNSYLI